jgi:hypothetical protein
LNLGHPGEIKFRFHWAGRFSQMNPSKICFPFNGAGTDYLFLLSHRAPRIIKGVFLNGFLAAGDFGARA